MTRLILPLLAAAIGLGALLSSGGLDKQRHEAGNAFLVLLHAHATEAHEAAAPMQGERNSIVTLATR